MSMTVGDLLRELGVYYDENVGDLRVSGDMTLDTEIRLAMQPSWPFEYSIYESYLRPKAKPLKSDEEVDSMSEVERDKYMVDCENGVYSDDDELSRPILYLVESSQIGYLPGIVKNNIGW